MSGKTSDAVKILKRRLIGSDRQALAALQDELINAEVARLIHDARRESGLSQKQLAEKVGTTQSVVSRLEDADYGRHTVTMLKRIGAALGRRLEVLFAEEGSPEVTGGTGATGGDGLAEIIDRCPAKEMRKRDWLPSWETVEQLRASLRRFLGPTHRATVAHFRRSRQQGTDETAVICWLTKLEIEGERIGAPKFSSTRLRRELGDLVRLSSRKEGPLLAIEWLEDRGVRCVFIRHLQHTYLDGAAILLDDGSPAIGMSLRHDRLDNFWFTLLHEVGHVLLHRKDLASRAIVDEDIETDSDDPLEVEANHFARHAWIPTARWKRFRQQTRDYPRLADITALAAKLDVTPALVAGRLRHELRRWRQYGDFLGRRTVRSLLSREYTIF